MTQAEKVIAAAEKWLGYLEKKNASQLADLTANAGSANYTIFAKRYKELWGENYQGQPWCATYVSVVCYDGCGKEIVKHFAYCPYGVNWFKKQGRWHTSKPKVGDIIFFMDSNGVACHVGIVVAVNGSTITTIEGNTSNAAGVIANGGCVRKKTYNINYSRILGYGRPAYEEKSAEGVDNKVKNILIISGHGGSPYDPGACGCGEKEAVLTRELALLVQAELKKVSGVNPILYNQNNDAYKVLRNGGSLPLSGMDYVFEIHFNAGVSDAGGNGKTTGVEVLVHTSENGIGVEEAVCKRIAALGFTNRGVKRRSDLLVMNTVKRSGISHALLETCFIDDLDDMRLYRSVKGKVAKAVAEGIAEGFGLAYTDTTPKEDDKTMTEAEVKKLVIQTVADMDVPTTAKSAAQDALNKSFNGLYDIANPLYTSLGQVPDYWRQEVREMIQCGAIKGDGKHEISIRREPLQAAIIAFRACHAGR